ncbi:MAG TPA: caspase family protein [Tepidisphaeraceae bacterium]|nr:caspase family protein [Tepidisphaeraceae bacterium]
MTYILDPPNPTPAPATHALVIGVGKYMPNTWQLPDLGSPPLSAEAFARWMLTEYRNPLAPLASMEVLWSPPAAPAPFARPGASQVQVDAATLTNVEQAIGRWFALCHQSVDNVAVFYFCGHGVKRGLDSWLLLEGFAGPAKLNLDDALKFTDFLLGMDKCLARKQIYFIDSCRDTPAAANNVQVNFGRTIVTPDRSATPGVLRDVAGLVSAADRSAFGANNEVSRLTQALLIALRGAGWDDRTHPWTEWLVSTDTLVTYVNALLQYEEQVRGAPFQRVQSLPDSANIIFHYPAPGTMPTVPLLIGLNAQPYPAPTAFAVSRGGAVVAQRPPMPADWEPAPQLEVAHDYVVSATSGGQTVQKPVVLRPACRIERL